MKRHNYFNEQDNQTAEYFNTIRRVLGEEYSDISNSEIEEILVDRLSDMTSEEIESFWKSVGNTIKKALPTVAPIIGGAVGTAIAPGIGTAIGTTLGKQLGNLAGGAAKQKPQAVRANIHPQTTGRPVTAQPAVNQLMALLNNPQLIQAILGQILGNQGTNTVKVMANGESKEIPFGAFMNAISELAERAAIEANENIEDEITSSYLQDEYGEYVCDPSSSEERAETLMNLLSQNYHEEKFELEENEFDGLTQWFIQAELIN